MQIVLEVSLSGMGGGGDGFQMTTEELEEGAYGPPTTHSSGTCLNLLSWAPQGITKTETSFYKLLTTKLFIANIRKKTVMNHIFHHSASITTKLTS